MLPGKRGRRWLLNWGLRLNWARLLLSRLSRRLNLSWLQPRVYRQQVRHMPMALPIGSGCSSCGLSLNWLHYCGLARPWSSCSPFEPSIHSGGTMVPQVNLDERHAFVERLSLVPVALLLVRLPQSLSFTVLGAILAAQVRVCQLEQL